MIPHDPTKIALGDAAKRLGCCKRLLSNYARSGVLPYPDEYGRFPLTVIEELEARWARERAEARAKHLRAK